MLVDIIMPKMGESITEGTIIEWRKKIGDTVEKDEIFLEIGTDKVDSEIPSPAAGILVEILANPNDVIDVGKVIARINTEADAQSGDTITDNSDAIAESAETKESPEPDIKKLSITPKKKIDKSAKSVVIDVIKVLDKVSLIDKFVKSKILMSTYFFKFSLTLSKITTVSFIEYPTIVKTAATIDKFISKLKAENIPSVIVTS